MPAVELAVSRFRELLALENEVAGKHSAVAYQRSLMRVGLIARRVVVDGWSGWGGFGWHPGLSEHGLSEGADGVDPVFDGGGEVAADCVAVACAGFAGEASGDVLLEFGILLANS